ncbi:MAG: hypothetical protein WCR19_03435 [Acholeplasmataceae bacterium]
MGIYRKNIKIQLILFSAFTFLGINVLVNYLLDGSAPWYNYTVLGISLLLIVWVIIIFKKQDQKIIPIEKKLYDAMRIALYSYFVIYVLNLILQSFEAIDGLILNIVTSVFLTLIALFGVILHVKLLKQDSLK